ncbi:complex I subunit 5 family protein [Saccharomonospora cyanea]|uniref:NADH:ubiquinone oxidoreductase subunit 4 (Chain M) n=1 Tax=Saccharomonospora cyanea NA-134 TaxID=882082 RepID=H5XIK7_9PSEU|nr:proton-conducting transporter membrane subunit [Saccharomonospora cyanea]EHR62868.1 NADH:ubiquinone oxidoreductase subunit 4 (chain M) [Saccharomonospora cyanea NA-134]
MTAVTVALALPWVAGVVLVGLDGRRPAVAWLAVGALAADLAALTVLAVDVFTTGTTQVVTGGWPAGVGIVLRADAMGVTFALLSVFVLLVAATAEAINGVRLRTFPGLVVLLATGLSGLFLTHDVFNFYVFFELSMIVSYVLTAYGGRTRQLRAALVFTAVNLLGSFLFLLSVAGTYRVTGTLLMSDVAARMEEVPANAVLLIALGFFVAFSVKVGLFPFHFWLPTVYAGTRPAVAAILSGAVANIGSYGLLRFGVGMFESQLESAAIVVIVLGAASIVYGALLAVSRGDPAEMLAYSTIGQIGYVLVAIGVGGAVGLTAAVLYSVVNGLNKTLLFLSAGLRGKLVAAAFAIGAFSVAGVPPAAGFVGKLEMFRTAIAASSTALVVLLFVGSALSLVYLFQVYQHVFWHRSGPVGESAIGEAWHEASPLPLRTLMLVLAFVVLGAGLWPEPLLALSGRAAEALIRR